MRGLAGRRVIVAGGAGGIGAAICRRLGEEGMQVVCADISEKRGRGVAEALSREGLTVSFERLDVGDPVSMPLSPPPISPTADWSTISRTTPGRRISG
jgi:NAD(P)-dependent dehydrogenase (short-subunit alcohol dehydrogenase family)